MNFLELAETILREENKPLTYSEIWEIAKQKGYDKQVNTTGKTPWATLGSRLYVDIKDNPASKFIKVSQKPIRFFLKELVGQIPPESFINLVDEKSGVEIKFKERDLHKYLAYFVYNQKFIYTKTIYHEESNKKQYSQWIHPDMVGVYFPIEEWESEILDISKEIGSSGIRLYSFEIKKALSFSNLRESYFQAVSNSSWANEGYLVAGKIEEEEEFLQELKRLNNSFGIGVIRLNTDDPDASEVLLPAREKEYVDIETMNKIAQVSPNFKEFLRRIKSDLNSREIRKEKYDKIYEYEELIKK